MDINWKFNIRTDLAIEAREMAEEETEEIPGVKIEVTESDTEDITITWVTILDEEGELAMGKPVGNYISIESQSMKENNVTCHEEIIKILAEKLIALKKLSKDSLVLIVGLGNWNVTPDALGPKVISKILVTRHVFEEIPEEIDSAVRPVCAVSPGVMGITGIETSEIIKGIVEKVKPDLVIAIDALAARNTNRINATIQMSDTGVAPGGGMGNRRMPLDEEHLGVPVIAIGVPTVVDAATLVNDTMDRMIKEMMASAGENSPFYTMLNNLNKEEKYKLIVEILNPYTGNMFVTPKEVDAVVGRLSNIIANGINIALHPGIDPTDINRYMN